MIVSPFSISEDIRKAQNIETNVKILLLFLQYNVVVQERQSSHLRHDTASWPEQTILGSLSEKSSRVSPGGLFYFVGGYRQMMKSRK